MPCAVPSSGGFGAVEPQAAPRARRSAGPELNGTFLPSAETLEPARGWAGLDPTAHPVDGERNPTPSADDLVLQTLSARAAARQRAGSAAGRGADAELILDDSNLLPFDFLRTGDRVGRAVVKIERADGASGTAFLVAPGILLTNHHVLPDPTTAAGARALANYELQPAGDAAGRPLVVPLRPERLFLTNEDLDFTFCGVSDLDHLGAIPLGRDSLDVVRSEYVNIIQHPRGRPKEVALQDNQVVKVDPVVLHYSCDTEPGSSGSPVFNNRWQLVALHHASVSAQAGAGGRRAAGTDGRGRFLNEGIRLSAIALWLESTEAQVPALQPQAARVRGLFEGLDPQAGFFGALGLHSAGRHAGRFVRECYRRGDGVLDVAAWDLTGPWPLPPARAALADLGWTLAEMGLDLWCLHGLAADDAGRLADHLESHHRLDYEVLTAPGLPGSLLARRGRWAWQLDQAADPVVPALPVHRVRARSLTHPERQAQILIRPACGPDPWASPPAPDVAPTTAPSEPLLVLAAGVWPGRQALESLRHALPDPHLACGPEGALLVVDADRGALTRVYVAPHLEPEACPGPQGLIQATDRPLPATLQALATRAPLAARLVFGPAVPRLATATASPPTLSGESSPDPRSPTNPARTAPPDAPGALERTVAELLRPVLDRLAAVRPCCRCGVPGPDSDDPEAGATA